MWHGSGDNLWERRAYTLAHGRGGEGAVCLQPHSLLIRHGTSAHTLRQHKKICFSATVTGMVFHYASKMRTILISAGGDVVTQQTKNASAAVVNDCGLADVPLHTDVWVCALQLDVAPQEHDVLLRLLEIGFLPGECLRVVARSFPGGDPLAVRVGRTTFALRRREASLIRVTTTPPVQEQQPAQELAA